MRFNCVVGVPPQNAICVELIFCSDSSDEAPVQCAHVLLLELTLS
jgi:hypothetical protein